ncbi:hypothetical protein [Daejeonella sp.]|uniref:hypothetical protein n=1 Tax=Daejeonella sp. TaxID=2805397 RepID=UPI0030C09496
MPVLITAGLSPEAYRLKRILAIDEVVFADQSPLPQIPGSRSLVIPPYTSSSFVHEVLKGCLDLGITKIYPLQAGEVTELSKARSLFLEYNVKLIIPSEEWLKNHEPLVKGSAEDITVLEEGTTVAAEGVSDTISLNNETGVFSGATNGQNTEYCLYLIEDAGI